MNYLHKLVAVAFAAFFIAGSAFAQNTGAVTNHAFIIGKGAGTTGYTSLLCTSAQLAVGQSAADPICRTITGDVTISAAGATAIGATKVTSAMLNADVFSTAHSWAGQQTFVAPILGTPASGTLTNATGLPISTGVSGLGTGVAAFLATPSSANLRAALTDEAGTGAAYFVGGALGTPSSGTGTNFTGIPIDAGTINTLPIARGGTNDTGTAWTAYTPTVACQSGTLTSATPTGAYKSIGKTFVFSASVLITTNGTCAGYLTVSLPATLATATVLNAASNNNSAALAYGTGGGNTVFVLKYDGTYPGSNGNTIMLSGAFQGS